MTTLPMVNIGNTGLSVPLVGFGTAPLGTGPAWKTDDIIPEQQAVESIFFAFEQGVRWFDAAPYYTKGLAELRVGKALAQLPREQVVITTKIGAEISGADIMRDYSRDGVLRSLEGSLKRLNVDQVDALYIHDPDHHYRQALDEAFPALADLRSQGVIKAVGAAMNQWQMLMDFAYHADFDCFLLAGRYTLLEHGALPLLDLCLTRGITVFAAAIYNSGILATGVGAQARYNHAPARIDILNRVQQIENICQQHEVPLHRAATHFPLGHPAVKAIIVGFQTPAEVQACLDALRQPVPVDLWEHLRRAELIAPDLPVPRGEVGFFERAEP
jgi:D-threo-aldose 1-dehydrogenase